MALRYGKWGQTAPFHSEPACGQVFCGALSADAMMERAKKQNKRALGAGALVRCPLLAAFATSHRSVQGAAEIARADARLSHPSLTLCDASATYTVLAQCLIGANGDSRRAFAELRRWMDQELSSRESPHSSSIVEGGYQDRGWVHLEQREKPKTSQGKEEEYVAPGASLVAFKEVRDWTSQAFGDADLPFAEERLPSSARVAFTHALRHVKLGSSFEDAMRATLAGGVDCSANAAVVGGLVGAAVGLEGIPARWLQAVLACETVLGQQRPQEYHPGRLPGLVQRICG